LLLLVSCIVVALLFYVLLLLLLLLLLLMLDYTHCLILAQSALVFFYIFLKGKKERRQLWRFSGHSNHVLFLAEASCWWGCFHYSHLSSFKEGKLTERLKKKIFE